VPYLGCTHSFVASTSFQYSPVVVATLVMDTRNDLPSSRTRSSQSSSASRSSTSILVLPPSDQNSSHESIPDDGDIASSPSEEEEGRRQHRRSVRVIVSSTNVSNGSLAMIDPKAPFSSAGKLFASVSSSSLVRSTSDESQLRK
jgi:hypothetical protein